MVSIYGGSGGGGFDYVQDPSPQDPKEGEEWYDTGSDSAFVYDGDNWIEQTITEHDKLSGVTSDQHHSKTTDHDELSGVGAGDHHPPANLSSELIKVEARIGALSVGGSASDSASHSSAEGYVIVEWEWNVPGYYSSDDFTASFDFGARSYSYSPYGGGSGSETLGALGGGVGSLDRIDLSVDGYRDSDNSDSSGETRATVWAIALNT